MRIQILVLMAVLALGGLIASLQATPENRAQALAPGEQPGVTSHQQQEWHIIRITFRDRADLSRLAERLDLWEVNHPEQYLVARVTRTEYDELVSEGYAVMAHTLAWQINAPPGYPCYRTVTEMFAAQNAWATTYPTLTQIITIGTSYEGRPLRVLVLTNKNHVVPGWPKPRFFLMANIHGREFITPEVAMEYVRTLLEGYGSNPIYTWLLDWREIHVLISANPDGHVKNEPSASILWRKNAHQNSCSSTYGTDLNRNSSFQWGGAGSSSNTCSELYRGPLPASEWETYAIQSYVADLFPDQRGPALTDAAPMTTTGILITLHSYSNLVLWPFGYDYVTAPNDAQLAALGQKLASFNGYTPQPSHDLYPASGTTDDWSYGELGIASYTFEIGSSSDGFIPICTSYNALVYPNVNALLYATRVTRAPYQNTPGPDAISLMTATLGNALRVTATLVSDHVISAAQAFVDQGPWQSGPPLPMTAADGTFDTVTEVAALDLALQDLTAGRHTLYVRGQDSTGNWGPVAWTDFYVNRALASIIVAPNPITLTIGGVQQFTASGYDQLGALLVITPNWSTNGGDINAQGIFTAQITPATGLLVTATQETISGAAIINLITGCVSVYGADLIWSPDSPSVSQTVAFTGSVLGGALPITYTWNWRDGSPEQMGNPISHAFAISGAFIVVMTTTNACGPVATERTVTIADAVWHTIYLPMIWRP